MEWGLLSAQVYIETQIQFAALYAGTSCMQHYLRSYHTSLGSLSNGNDNDNDDDDDDNDDDDGSENVAKQGISLKTLQHLFGPFQFPSSNLGDFSWSLTLKDFIQVKKEKEKFLIVCPRPPKNVPSGGITLQSCSGRQRNVLKA